MNSRERVEMALNFDPPDRVPVFASFVPEIEQRLRQAFDISEADVGAVLGNDMVKCCAGMEMSFYGEPAPEYVDAWGIRWRRRRISIPCRVKGRFFHTGTRRVLLVCPQGDP